MYYGRILSLLQFTLSEMKRRSSENNYRQEIRIVCVLVQLLAGIGVQSESTKCNNFLSWISDFILHIYIAYKVSNSIVT